MSFLDRFRPGGGQVTRAPGETARALTAASERIKISTSGEGKRLVKKPQEWQRLAWDYFDAVGEVKYSCSFLGNSLARLRLFVAERPDPEQEPVPTTDAQAIDALERLAAPIGGHSEIMRRYGINMNVPGECYLLGLTPQDESAPDATGIQPGIAAGRSALDEAERWEIRSTDEVVKGPSGKLMLLDSPGAAGTSAKKGRELTEDDFVMRLWHPHARYADLADSPMRGVLSACEELLILERATRAAGKSRVAGAGMLLWPEELSDHLGQADRMLGEEDGEAEMDPVLKDLLDSMTAAIADEDSASAVAPVIIRAKATLLKEVRHLTFDRPMDAEIDKRTQRALQRLAQGLNVPIERVLGMTNANHWTAWEIDDDSFKSHVEPDAILAVGSLTTGYLYPALRAAGVTDPERFIIWYDPTKLVARPNRTQDAKDAHTAMIISDAATRRELQFGDDDAPDDEELLRRLGMNRGTMDPDLTRALLELIARGVGIALPEAPPPGEEPPPELPAGDEGGDDGDGDRGAEPGPPEGDGASLAAAGTQETSTDLGRRLLAIDRSLRERLQVAADAALRRALERAGAQVRSHAKKDQSAVASIRAVDNTHVASRLGPSLVASLGVEDAGLVETAFDGLEPQFTGWVQAAQEAALSEVTGITDRERETFGERFATGREEAWTWLRTALVILARERLYDPDPRAPEQGEFDATMSVPVGLIREALARAGGAASPDATIAAGDLGEDFRAGFGVATGPTMQRALEEHGTTVEEFEWDYGVFPRINPFEPHAELHGVRFERFTDPALANDEGWPPEPFFTPGDHDGCYCDFVLVTSEGAAAASTAEGWTFADDETRISLAPGRVEDAGQQMLGELTTQQQEAVVEYTTGAYEELNAAMREGTTLSPEQRWLADRLDTVITAAPPLPEPVTVFRGLQLGPGGGLGGQRDVVERIGEWATRTFRPGARLQLEGYQSTSFFTEPALDASLSRSSPGVIFEIRTRAGAYLNAVTRYDDEAELLLGRNTRYRVVKVLRDVDFEKGDYGDTVRRTVVQLEVV